MSPWGNRKGCRGQGAGGRGGTLGRPGEPWKAGGPWKAGRPCPGGPRLTRHHRRRGTRRPDTRLPSATARPHDTRLPGATARPHDTRRPGATARPHDTRLPSATARPRNGRRPSGSTPGGPSLWFHTPHPRMATGAGLGRRGGGPSQSRAGWSRGGRAAAHQSRQRAGPGAGGPRRSGWREMDELPAPISFHLSALPESSWSGSFSISGKDSFFEPFPSLES
jgi:hypothetical protein